MSQELLSYFDSPKTFVHELGHFIPVTPESKAAFVEFFSQVRKAE